MTTELQMKDLRLTTDSGLVTMVEFGQKAFGILTLEGRLSIYTPFVVRWPDGAISDYDPGDAAGSPIAHRLLDSLLGAHISAAFAGANRSDLRVEFDNGIGFELTPSNASSNNWSAENPDGARFSGHATGELRVTGYVDYDNDGAGGPAPIERASEVESGNSSESDEPRVIDLEITDHIYGVTVYGASVRLETRGGSVYIAGPFQVTDSTGEVYDFDPAHLFDDTVAGALLSVLIDHKMGQITLKPDTSELTVTLASGAGLSWKASSAAQAQFSAKLRNGRQFWSKGDGTIYWFGGPEGTHPKFLVGGPKATD